MDREKSELMVSFQTGTLVVFLSRIAQAYVAAVHAGEVPF